MGFRRRTLPFWLCRLLNLSGVQLGGGMDCLRQVPALPREPFLALSVFLICRGSRWSIRSAEKTQ